MNHMIAQDRGGITTEKNKSKSEVGETLLDELNRLS